MLNLFVPYPPYCFIFYGSRYTIGILIRVTYTWCRTQFARDDKFLQYPMINYSHFPPLKIAQLHVESLWSHSRYERYHGTYTYSIIQTSVIICRYGMRFHAFPWAFPVLRALYMGLHNLLYFKIMWMLLSFGRHF